MISTISDTIEIVEELRNWSVGARIWDLYASVTFVSLVLHKSDTEG
jgi:hypothetical protein